MTQQATMSESGTFAKQGDILNEKSKQCQKNKENKK